MACACSSARLAPSWVRRRPPEIGVVLGSPLSADEVADGSVGVSPPARKAANSGGATAMQVVTGATVAHASRRSSGGEGRPVREVHVRRFHICICMICSVRCGANWTPVRLQTVHIVQQASCLAACHASVRCHTHTLHENVCYWRSGGANN